LISLFNASKSSEVSFWARLEDALQVLVDGRHPDAEQLGQRLLL